VVSEEPFAGLLQRGEVADAKSLGMLATNRKRPVSPA
jgi:hypothetical protein